MQRPCIKEVTFESLSVSAEGPSLAGVTFKDCYFSHLEVEAGTTNDDSKRSVVKGRWLKSIVEGAYHVPVHKLLDGHFWIRNCLSERIDCNDFQMTNLAHVIQILRSREPAIYNTEHQ